LPEAGIDAAEAVCADLAVGAGMSQAEPGASGATTARSAGSSARRVRYRRGMHTIGSGPSALPSPLRVQKGLRAVAEYNDVRKSAKVAYALWCVVGIFGGHRFYLGDTGRSVGMLFTLGGLGLWTLVDVFLIGRRVREVNEARRAEVLARHRIADFDGSPIWLARR
jgi:TM2 domain-containing membrane protein YozV